MRKDKQREFAREWQFDDLSNVFTEEGELAREAMMATLRRASERYGHRRLIVTCRLVAEAK